MERIGESFSLNLSLAQQRHLEELSGQDITEGDIDNILRDYRMAADDITSDAGVTAETGKAGEDRATRVDKKKVGGEEANSGSAKRMRQGEGSESTSLGAAEIREATEFLQKEAEPMAGRIVVVDPTSTEHVEKMSAQGFILTANGLFQMAEKALASTVEREALAEIKMLEAERRMEEKVEEIKAAAEKQVKEVEERLATCVEDSWANEKKRMLFMLKASNMKAQEALSKEFLEVASKFDISMKGIEGTASAVKSLRPGALKFL